jgi:hypothetical protein
MRGWVNCRYILEGEKLAVLCSNIVWGNFFGQMAQRDQPLAGPSGCSIPYLFVYFVPGLSSGWNTARNVRGVAGG